MIRKISLAFSTICILFLFVEIFMRILFAFYIGPSVILYGTKFAINLVQSENTRKYETEMPDASTFLNSMNEDEWFKRRDVEIHSNKINGYAKYFPNQKRYDFDIETGEQFEVTINKQGFRGHDFLPKRKGVIRILCLGASSTFGYFDRDNETYPVYLEEILKLKSSRNFEVLNLGIPHLTSADIYELFVNEGLELEPDIVTFYEGNNDSDPPQEWIKKSFLHAAIKKVGNYSLISKLLDSVSSRFLPFLYQDLSDSEILEIRKEFIDNVSKIYSECSKRNIKFILANQQRNSQAFDRKTLESLTYQEEVEKIRNKLKGSGALIHPELALLIHAELMKDLETWANEHLIPFVDIIENLNENRDTLVSWVHLSPEGNRLVADAFSNKIIQIIEKDERREGPIPAWTKNDAGLRKGFAQPKFHAVQTNPRIKKDSPNPLQ